MNTVRDERVSRRSFLASAAVVGGVGVTGVHGLSLPFRGSIVASAATKQLSPNFVAGTLIELSASAIVVRVPEFSPDTVTLALVADTTIYGKTYGEAWDGLHLGDRIHAGSRLIASGQRAATWVIANFITGFGTVQRVDRDSVGVAVTPGMWGIARDLYIYPYTKVVNERGQQVEGSSAALARGDNVYFTATGWDSNPWVHDVRAYYIYKLQ